jgi:hypothetical protein
VLVDNGVGKCVVYNDVGKCNNVGTCVVYNGDNHNNNNGNYNKTDEARRTYNSNGINNGICMQGATMRCVRLLGLLCTRTTV